MVTAGLGGAQSIFSIFCIFCVNMHILHIMHIYGRYIISCIYLHMLHISAYVSISHVLLHISTYTAYSFNFPGWLARVDSTMIYERRSNKQVLYVLPITSILGKLPVVPAGDTGTIPACVESLLTLMEHPVTPSPARETSGGKNV